ncbi:MAG: GNAT family N-acetyltransferase [Bacteroidota bacterium]
MARETDDMTLKTDRLHLRPLQKEDEDWFLELNGSPFVRKYLWDDQVIDRETGIQIINQSQASFQQRRYGLWKIQRQSDQSAVGYVGLWFFFDEDWPQLLYALQQDFAGQGYASEAAQAVVGYALDQLHFPYLLAAMDTPHFASQLVAKRLGFVFIEERIVEGKPTLFFRKDGNQAKG